MSIKLESEFLKKSERGDFNGQFMYEFKETTVHESVSYIHFAGSNRYKTIFLKLMRENIIELIFNNKIICVSLTNEGESYKRELEIDLVLT